LFQDLKAYPKDSSVISFPQNDTRCHSDPALREKSLWSLSQDSETSSEWQ